jgi:ATP-dependent exoDNAse (exonuclease V) beta subunit
LHYHRTPLKSARDEEAVRSGNQSASPPVSVIVLSSRDTEGPELVATIADTKKKSRCKWSDFAILYRSHFHRDDIVHDLAEAEIPFVIESMDVSDTPEARDQFACVYAVVNAGDDVSLFRVAALPRFKVDAEQLRQTMRKIARDSREGKIIPLATVLGQAQGGAEVVAAVERTREEIRSRQLKGRAAVDLIVREFALDTTSPSTQAVLKFIEAWETKKVNRSTELEELVDYLGYFRDAGGVISLQASDNEDAVRLMTVHGAKGLEFSQVFILRANSNSFPCPYKETLVAFPKELRDAESVTEDDDNALHKQEERRLFYVAMTRARDALRIYSREGRGKANKNPDGYMRELIEDRSLRPYLNASPASGAQARLEIFAGASPAYPAESQTTLWFELPVLPGLHTRLSASAVDTYERCGLQFKIDRDWRLAAKPAAAMQYGAAIHRVLKTYFDAIQLGRPKTDAELIDLFRQDLANAKIDEAYQQELYENQGIQQLRAFLDSLRSAKPPQVLHTEQPFEIKVGDTIVVGRIDRIDSRPDGTVSIIDYKTGKARVQEDADKSLQLSLYAIAAHEKWGYKVGALVFHNLEDNIPVMTLRADSELAAVRQRVRDASEGILAGKFEARPGKHCDFCSYRSLCPAREKRFPRSVAAAVYPN